MLLWSWSLWEMFAQISVFFSFLLSFGFMLLHHLYAFCVEGILRYLNFWLGFSLYCCSLPIFIRLHVISLIFLFFYFFPSLPFSIALSFSLALSQFQTYKNPLKFFVEEANKTGEKKNLNYLLILCKIECTTDWESNMKATCDQSYELNWWIIWEWLQCSYCFQVGAFPPDGLLRTMTINRETFLLYLQEKLFDDTKCQRDAVLIKCIQCLGCRKKNEVSSNFSLSFAAAVNSHYSNRFIQIFAKKFCHFLFAL